MSIVPLEKVNEIIDIFGSPGLKNLNNFSELGKVKAGLKRSMMAIIENDPIQSCTGLGILYAYENNYNLALESFRKAYMFSNQELVASIHYSNAEFAFGEQRTAIPIYLDLIKNHYYEKDFVTEVILRFCAHLYIDELKEILLNQNVLIHVDGILKNEISEAYRIIDFLNKNNISIDYYRELRDLPEKIFNLYYCSSTSLEVNRCLDSDRNELTISYVLPTYPNQSFGNNLLQKFNDELQLSILELNEKFEVQTGSPEDLITVYFSVEDQVEGVA